MSEPVTTKAPGRRRMYLLVRMLCEGGLMIALALVLGLLKVFELPQGGSISLEMLPLLFFCVRWGMGGGFIACFAFGVLQVFIQGAVSWAGSPSCWIMCWPSVLWASRPGPWQAPRHLLGQRAGRSRPLCCPLYQRYHHLQNSGPHGDLRHSIRQSRLYSLIYNGSYVGIDLVLCLVIFGILYAPLKKYMMGADLRR